MAHLRLGRSPGLGDIRQEGPRKNCVDAHRRRKGLSQSDSEGIEARLGARVWQLSNAGDEGARGADVDDRTAVVLGHVRSGAHGKTKGPLEINAESLVIQVLGNIVEVLVRGDIPALFTSTSSRPKCSSVRSINCSQSSQRPT